MGNSLRTKRDITIAVFGLDGAGKSTFIDNLNEEDCDDIPLPTVGYNTRKITKGRYNIVLAEVGGGIHIRGVWPKYYAQSHALIYMIDGTSSMERIQETKQELHKVLLDNRMSCKPLLVLCNKDDQPNSIDPNNLVTELDLINILQESVDNSSGLVTQLNARVWLCSCLRSPTSRQDPRLHKSLNWLLQRITDNWPILSQRVLEEHRVELEEKERERQARIAKRRQRIEEEERLEREAIAKAEEETAEASTSVPINTEQQVIAEVSPTASPPSPPLSPTYTIPNDHVTTSHPIVLPPLSSHSKIENVNLMSSVACPDTLQPITTAATTTASVSHNNGGKNTSVPSTDSTVQREGDLGGATASKESVKSTRSVKKARIIRRLKSRNNKLHPIDSDISTKTITSSSTASSNGLNTLSSSFSSKPPLLSPWISNDVQLPVEHIPSSLTNSGVLANKREGVSSNHNDNSNGNNEEEKEKRTNNGGGNNNDSMKLKRKNILAPITNHSMASSSFTLPQDIILSPPLSMDSSSL